MIGNARLFHIVGRRISKMLPRGVSGIRVARQHNSALDAITERHPRRARCAGYANGSNVITRTTSYRY